VCQKPHSFDDARCINDKAREFFAGFAFFADCFVRKDMRVETVVLAGGSFRDPDFCAGVTRAAVRP
jgi:hypothetical protein